MKIFITGVQGSGKSTLFRILTSAEEGSNSWISEVEDKRIFSLHRLYPDKKVTKIRFEYHDLPPAPEGGKSLLQYLDSLKIADLIIYIVKNFNGDDPFKIINMFEEELRISDLSVLESSIQNLERDLKKMRSPEKERWHELLVKIKNEVEAGRPVREFPLTSEEMKYIKGFAFLSFKPVLYAINVSENETKKIYDENLRIKRKGFLTVTFSGRLELEIFQLDVESREEFMREWGLKDFAKERIEDSIIDCMEMIIFYTIGKDEIRSWLIPSGTKAIKAAGTIHTDMEKGFIRAEVISFEELMKIGSLKEAKEHGLIRIEGKDYVVNDGDIVYIRFTS